ncbi:unnamed protein product [Moneuplotes crassus]|uniref:Uncharacterized protein n=1 Tax=Euplotes crassus TaxID=5936 RepID=A0AAD1U8M8_EUPCR|nr:unnamed protein product [Moneuplotes crassus]
MSATQSAKYNQYLKEKFEETYYGNKIQQFCDYLGEIGLLSSANDVFIIKRRAKMASKDIKDDEEADIVFDTNTKDILEGFLEDRAPELAENVVNNWPNYLDLQAKRDDHYEELRKADKLKSVSLLMNAKKRAVLAKYMNRWKFSILNEKIATLQHEIEEKDHKIERLQHDNIQKDCELRESNHEARQLSIRLETILAEKNKKKNALARRKKMKQVREASRSLAIEKASKMNVTNSVCVEDPYMVNEDKKAHKTGRTGSTAASRKDKRKDFIQKERGSVDTVKILRRKKLQMSKASHSVCTASAYSKHFNSNLSFHPEINRDERWTPKYDDHDDHQKMVQRMHDESRKIERKKRIMSSEKDRQELSECSFTPKLVTKKRGNKSTLKKLKTEDAKKLGERMYEYAAKHKASLDTVKSNLDSQRGQEVNFTPKIVKTKTLKIDRSKGEVYDDLYQDFSRRVDKKNESKKLRNKKKNYASFVTKIHISDLGKQGSGKNSYVNQVINKAPKQKPKPKAKDSFVAVSSSSFSVNLYNSPLSSTLEVNAEPQSDSTSTEKNFYFSVMLTSDFSFEN